MICLFPARGAHIREHVLSCREFAAFARILHELNIEKSSQLVVDTCIDTEHDTQTDCESAWSVLPPESLTFPLIDSQAALLSPPHDSLFTSAVMQLLSIYHPRFTPHQPVTRDQRRFPLVTQTLRQPSQIPSIVHLRPCPDISRTLSQSPHLSTPT